MAKAYLYSLTDTWDSAGTTFNAIKMNVTDTASAAASNLLDLQVGGSSRFSVRKDGLLSTAQKAYFASATVTLGETGSGEVTVRSSGGFGWSPDTTGLSTPDTILRRDAANTLAQRNGTNAQTFRVYETYTDASNYVRATILNTLGFAWFGQQGAGTGTGNGSVLFGSEAAAKPIYFRPLRNGFGWFINQSSHFYAETDNTYDIGASGANRPRNVYVGTSVVSPGFVTAASGYVGWSGATLIRGATDGILRLSNNAETDFGRLQFGGTTSAFPALKRSGAALHLRLADDSTFANLECGAVTALDVLRSEARLHAHYATAIPAGGTTGAGVRVSSTANFGMFFGSGAPTLSAAKGSIYLRSDGTTTNDRMYVNTDGATTWTAVTTAA